MIAKYGNVWDAWAGSDLFVITTNSKVHGSVRNDTTIVNPRLVMGAGVAGEAAKQFVTWGIFQNSGQLPSLLGKTLTDLYGFYRINTTAYVNDYHLLVSPRWPDAKLALLQTKRDPHKPSPLDLVAKSIEALHHWAEEHPTSRVVTVFPAIGNGGAKLSEVSPLVEALPDNVYVWRRASERPPDVVAVKDKPEPKPKKGTAFIRPFPADITEPVAKLLCNFDTLYYPVLGTPDEFVTAIEQRVRTQHRGDSDGTYIKMMGDPPEDWVGRLKAGITYDAYWAIKKEMGEVKAKAGMVQQGMNRYYHLLKQAGITENELLD